MKLLTYALVLIAAITAAGCNSESQSTERILFGASENVSQICFDRKMEAWYTSFQEYQSAGYDMAEADAKAVAEALMACDQCMAESTAEE